MTKHPDEQVAADSRDPNAGGIPPWQWPKWLTCVAISRDNCGLWYAWDCVPDKDDEGGDLWVVPDEGGDFILLNDYVDTSGFPDVPWNESLRVNPNCKAT